MLYTASVTVSKKAGRKMKLHHIMRSRGNDAVVPDQLDLEQYRTGASTWLGFRVSYLGKLTRPEATEWMERVSAEAAKEDVVVVSDEENGKNCYRILLAEMMANMFSGKMNLRYAGELR